MPLNHLDTLELLRPPALPFRSTPPPHTPASSSSSRDSRASKSSRHSRLPVFPALTGTNAVFHTRPRQIKTIPPPQNNTRLNGRAQLEKVGRIIYAMLFLRHVAAPALKNRGRVKKSICKKLPNPKCSMCRLARPYLRASFQWLSRIAETFMSSRRYRRHNIAQTARLFRRDYAAFVLASDKARRKKL